MTLHVGLGTFRPVKVEDVTDHHMHSEFYIVEPEQAELINRVKKRRREDCGSRNDKLPYAGVGNR